MCRVVITHLLGCELFRALRKVSRMGVALPPPLPASESAKAQNCAKRAEAKPNLKKKAGATPENRVQRFWQGGETATQSPADIPQPDALNFSLEGKRKWERCVFMQNSVGGRRVSQSSWTVFMWLWVGRDPMRSGGQIQAREASFS